MNRPAFFNRQFVLISFAFIAVLATAIIGYQLFSAKKITTADPDFGKYIEAYTSGVISKQGTIRIQLATEVPTLHASTGPEERNLFSFSPAVKGKSYWTDARTIEFRPDENLKPGETYNTKFNLGDLADVTGELDEFEFQFRVIKPSFKTEHDGLKALSSSSLELMKLTGTLYMADNENPAQVEKLLIANQQGKRSAIRWVHDAANRNSRFTIDSIQRGKQETRLSLTWDGEAIGSDVKGNETISVPATGDFKVLDIKAMQDPEQYLLVQFSDPILVAQDLNGLIGISNVSDLHYTIDGSEVKIYSPDRLEGNYSVLVNEGIENIVSRKITKSMSANAVFENRMPSVSIPGKGTILPNSGKLTFPFEAVNLNAVDVTIVKIIENNIPQYFQVNDMNGGQELRRVAKPVVMKTIRLDQDKALNLKRKNRFSLDIDKLLKAETGAIYRITIGFRRSYSVFGCDENQVTENESGERNYYGEKIDEDDDFWSRYDNYYPDDYNWEERDNPCTNSYYTNERWAVRNVLASNIGLVAKRGNDNAMLVAATDILTTEPMGGIELQLLDYQQQVIQTATTSNDGLAKIEVKRKPYLLIARKGDQRSYLKLDDGTSLPLSRFDVGGDVIQSGIKGFMYGERGVWRPGDSVFVGFILEDKTGTLPEGHPITFELYNPQGQLNKRLIRNKGINGFYTFKTATDAGAPTGNWQAKIKAGGATFQKSIKIETVMPNRLKISLDFGDKKELVKGAANTGTLSAKWLFGADAQNLKAKIDATLTAGKTSFKRFAGYVFDDPTSAFASETKTVFDGRLNENGIASVNAALSTSANAPGILKANFATKVFDPGGNFSIDNFSMPYHVYNAYVGLQLPQGDQLSGMLLTDRDHTIRIANVNTKGELLTGRRKVQVEFYKIQWRWWWDEGQENLSNFTQDRYNQLLKKETITLNNGTGKWVVRVNQPDWGRYLIRVKDMQSGHTSGETVYIDWPGWAQREQQNSPTEASMLSFTADKQKYAVGQEVTLTIPSSAGGRGLISIESGSKILKTWWVETQKGQTRFKFKVEKEMAPNVYVNVTLLQPHAQTANDLPIRMYGLIPILVENPQTLLKPVIALPAVLRPETASSITVSENSGKAMTYTIAIVDEGLLDLTRFKTPNPHGSFYAREALGVKTWDLFDHIIGAWGGDLERILSIGGDAEINRNVDPAKANRFKPVVKFMGPFYIGKGQKKTHAFKLPQYIGSVRIMVIAGNEGAYGFAEKTAAVKKPLMLLATLPRVAGPQETFKLPITVFAMENQIKKVNVQVQVNGLLTATGASQTVNFAKPGEKMIYADIKVKDAVGIAKVKIIARSGNEKAEYDVELGIRNPNPYITLVSGTELQARKSYTSTIAPIGAGGSNSATVEISSVPPMNLTKRLNYLIQYLHGCVEQITSSVFPQLFLNQLTDLTEQQKAATERNIKAGINRLKNFQASDGGLAYWPGEQQSDDWGTSYAGHFMLEAQERGYNLPAGFLDQWKKYQRNKAVSWTPSTTNFYGGDLSQAYRLYLLAMAEAPEIGAMNRLKEFQYLSDAAKWRLAAAYKFIGQAEIANSLVKGLGLQVKPYQQLGGTYGSDLRDQSMILETLTELTRRNEAAKLLLSVTSRLSQDNWYSTQTTAYALIAIAKYSGQNPSGAKMNYSYSLNGTKKTVNSNTVLSRIPVNFKVANNKFSVSNQGKNRLFVQVIRQGQTPTGENPPINNNADVLDMGIVYKTQSGKIIDPASLKQGTDFIAEVTVRNPGNRGNYEQMALTQIFPSGWEIINTRLQDNEGAVTSSPYTYRDIRDDRVLTYFNIRQSETLTYQVLLNASYTGRYYLPATSCEAMYDNSISALAGGKWVEVVR